MSIQQIQKWLEVHQGKTMEINSYLCRNDAEVLGNIFKELGVR